MEDQTFKIGEKEFSLEEIQGLIADGEQKREYESKYNTTFDNAWSAYGRGQNKIKELEEELSKVKEVKPTDTEEIDLDQEFKKRGYLTREETEKLFEEKQQYQQTIMSIANQFVSLEKEFNGADGRPKFDKQEILTYMEEHPGLLDPKQAYEMKNLDALASWKAKKLTETPEFDRPNEGNTATDKTPVPIKIDRNNVDSALREALAESRGKF